MRNMPRPLRISIASLYLRVRKARREHESTRRRLGQEHPATATTRAAMHELQNSLLHVRLQVQDEIDGVWRLQMHPKEFLALVGRSAHARRRNEERYATKRSLEEDLTDPAYSR